MANSEEIWRNIENYKNYEVSNLGRVRSKNREITRKDNNIIKKWDSITEASNTLNIDNSHIGQVCKGERKTAGGYKWAFEMEVVV